MCLLAYFCIHLLAIYVNIADIWQTVPDTLIITIKQNVLNLLFGYEYVLKNLIKFKMADINFNMSDIGQFVSDS